MKLSFSLRHLLALILLVAVAVQGYRAQKLQKRVEAREDGLRWREEQLRKQKPYRQQSELCRQVEDAYEYPGDYAAAERRFAQLKSHKAQGD